MNRVDAILSRRREKGHAAFMPFITGGYPSLDVTRAVIPALGECGADIVEIGFPFSDPVADGPVIAASMHHALTAGVSPPDILDTIGALRASTTMGLIAMTSCSIMHRMGYDAFLSSAAAAGFDGLIVPDLDLEDAADLVRQAAAHGLVLPMLIAPASSPDRMEQLADASTGFIYLLTRMGITGERDDLPDLQQRTTHLRTMTDLPIAAGFGITTPAHVAAASAHADAVIIGSALVRRMKDPATAINEASLFTGLLSQGLRGRS